MVESAGLPASIRNAALQRRFRQDHGWDFHADALTSGDADVLAVRISRGRRVFV
jgi:hypothetical protein